MNFKLNIFIMINESVEKACEKAILNVVKNPGFLNPLIYNGLATSLLRGLRSAQNEISKSISVCQ